ncbi:DapH/DapD/GlmU-related protein [Paenibacillus sp. LHD-38]|uniref:acyltransferase n=1 Tax=Paenibacillus sp. LHD-38 TaxID=3072143 RepID=UPI00280C4DE1|nr:DapH/DapD/GlmU-related protein [Paenibacillus sp. LHD-38]MDQ8737842.1 DapH/DapD/GlmU-related protein [Paenibacillus sp. LHD-38]
MAFSTVLYKLKGLYKFGKPAPRLRGKVFVNKMGAIQVGKNLSIVGHPWAVQITSTKGANLTFGDNVYVNAGVGIAANKEILIGDNVKIGPRTSIFDSNYHRLDSSDKGELRKSITIGNNVWIGADCTILPGVTIGDNSVIAAKSTVNKNIPNNVLAGGSPAKVIRELKIEDGWVRE